MEERTKLFINSHGGVEVLDEGKTLKISSIFKWLVCVGCLSAVNSPKTTKRKPPPPPPTHTHAKHKQCKGLGHYLHIKHTNYAHTHISHVHISKRVVQCLLSLLRITLNFRYAEDFKTEGGAVAFIKKYYNGEIQIAEKPKVLHQQYQWTLNSQANNS